MLRQVLQQATVSRQISLSRGGLPAPNPYLTLLLHPVGRMHCTLYCSSQRRGLLQLHIEFSPTLDPVDGSSRRLLDLVTPPTQAGVAMGGPSLIAGRACAGDCGSTYGRSGT